jgi:hypothetical protein
MEVLHFSAPNSKQGKGRGCYVILESGFVDAEQESDDGLRALKRLLDRNGNVEQCFPPTVNVSVVEVTRIFEQACAAKADAENDNPTE